MNSPSIFLLLVILFFLQFFSSNLHVYVSKHEGKIGKRLVLLLVFFSSFNFFLMFTNLQRPFLFLVFFSSSISTEIMEHNFCYPVLPSIFFPSLFIDLCSLISFLLIFFFQFFFMFMYLNTKVRLGKD